MDDAHASRPGAVIHQSASHVVVLTQSLCLGLLARLHDKQCSVFETSLVIIREIE